MNFHVMTLFPEMINNGVNTSITGKALAKGTITLNAVNMRDFSHDKHNHVDDYPYGGGAGMVIQPQPVYDCYQSITKQMTSKPRVVYLTPQGRVFDQHIAEELSKEEDIIFLCGHYEGIDERVLEEIVTDNLSIGDYVLTGGELAAMVMIDAIARLVPGVLNNDESAQFESFQDGLLEYPQYTRPVSFLGKEVPPVLLTGNHKKIEEWRRCSSIERTFVRRPDLLKNVDFDLKDQKRLAYIKQRLHIEKYGLQEQHQCRFDSVYVNMTHLIDWIEAKDENDIIQDIYLGSSLNHYFQKDAKKILKWIARHVDAKSCIELDLYNENKEFLENAQFIEKYTYMKDSMIWYLYDEKTWRRILSQWFKIISKDSYQEEQLTRVHYTLKLK